MATAYIAEESAVPVYCGLHQRLTARREAAQKSGGQGPRVLIAGPTDSGKSTLCRHLLAYCARVGGVPTFVDLDPGQGELTIPTCVAAAAIDRTCYDPESQGYPGAVPLVYFTGETSASGNSRLYEHHLAQLALAVDRRLAGDEAGTSVPWQPGARRTGRATCAAMRPPPPPPPHPIAARVAGIVVNTMGWVDGKGYDLLKQSIRAFRTDVIVVMGTDRLYARLTRDAPRLMPAGTSVSVVNIPRSGGVVERPRDVRRTARDARIAAYFYGQDKTLAPHSTRVRFSDVSLLQIGTVSTSAAHLPVGMGSQVSALHTTPVLPSPDLVGLVVGILHTTDTLGAAESSAAGFAHIRGVHMEDQEFEVLLPNATDLPGTVWVVGGLRWVE